MNSKTILNLNYLKSGVYYDNLSQIKNKFTNYEPDKFFNKKYHLNSNALKNLFDERKL